MTNSEWTTIIKPKNGWFDFNFKEVWHYRDLAVMLTKRNFTVIYKQTILGPLWILLNPLLTTIVFTVIFGGIANLSTDGAPQFLFYMAGNTLWGLVSTCVVSVSSTFTANSGVMGKVYFPRLIMPISAVFTAIFNMGIQLLMFLIFWGYFIAKDGIQPNYKLLWLIPLIVLQMALLGSGIGIIVSALTTKYRDLALAVPLFVQLWLYSSPVVYSLSTLGGITRKIVLCNPATQALETFKYIFLNAGTISVNYWIYTIFATAILLVIGLVLFSRIEKTFMDTV